MPASLDCRVKLYYFDAYGRASVLAMMLEMGGADWEFCAISSKEWPEKKF